MKQLVDVIKFRRSTIRDLTLNCGYVAGQDSDEANSSRWDQVAVIFHAKCLRHLHLLGVPDIITMSNSHLPMDMSTLETLRFRIDPGDLGFKGYKFHEMIKRARGLRRLTLDCPAWKCFEILKQLRVDFESVKGQSPRFTDIEFKHGNHSVICAMIDRATAEFQEFKLQITSELLGQIQWVDFFKSSLLRQLTTLDLDSCRGEGWVSEVLRWIKHEGRRSQSTLRTLHLDCQIIKNASRSRDLCELITLTRGNLERLRLNGLYFEKTNQGRVEVEEGELEDGEVRVDSGDRQSSREWTVFFQALNFKTLKMLHIEKGNLGNEDLALLVETMPIVKHKRLRVQLSATFVTEVGRKALEVGAEAKGWITNVVIADSRQRPYSR
ncbi:hypothetical protein BGZ58_007954 [Dissophora ornata]|nr:hypothetical protein BGZ58_007954 [Dissophora ornata]